MTVVVNQNDTVLVIAQPQNALIIGAGIQGLTGAAANVTGITGFTNGSGFTGNVTNNNLSIVLQNATANQSGQLTAGDWLLFNGTLGNVTLAQGNITDLQGNMTAAQGNITEAQGNITTTQGNITELTNLTATLNSTLSGHIGNFTNPHNVTATQLNLGNVDNTADLAKPISNLTQTALNAKLDASQKGATNGVAELVSGKVPSGQLPSYVDDIIEVANYAALPVTGDTGVLYVTLDTDLLYRWSGSAYVQVNAGSGGLVLGETSVTAYRGDRGKTAYDHSQTTHDKSFIGLANVSDVTSLELPVSNATQTALNLKADKSIAINGQNLSANVTLTTANVSSSTNKNYVTDSQLANITNLTGTNSGDQNLSGYVQDTRTINGQNLTANITINHSTNSGLGWTSAGHTGANLTVAGFNATGTATELSISGNGTSILSNNNADLGTPASGNLTNCNGTAAGLTAGNVTNINVSNVTGTLSVANGGTGFTSAQILYARDVKSNGTNGGTSSAGVNTRTLNTDEVATLTGYSASGNQRIIPAGTYEYQFSAPCGAGGANRAYLYDVTNGVILVNGNNASTLASSGYSESRGVGVFTVSVTTTIELRHYITSGVATVGLGVAVSTGSSEYYSSLWLKRIL